jgi:hypothetical protein
MSFYSRTLEYRVKGSCQSLLAMFFAAILLISSIVHGEERPFDRLAASYFLSRDTDGFVPITGGDDLRLWKGLPNYWYVDQGVLGGHQSLEASKQTFLILPFEVRDFELRLKYRFASPEGNSGIQFRSKVLDYPTYRVSGYQADFDATGDFDGSIYEEGGRGGLSARGERTRWNAENRRTSALFADGRELRSAIKAGDWNEVVLVAIGNLITYTINGQVMTELIDESPNAAAAGIIALQLHEGIAMDVQFKDGKIKILDRDITK